MSCVIVKRIEKVGKKEGITNINHFIDNFKQSLSLSLLSPPSLSLSLSFSLSLSLPPSPSLSLSLPLASCLFPFVPELCNVSHLPINVTKKICGASNGEERERERERREREIKSFDISHKRHYMTNL